MSLTKVYYRSMSCFAMNSPAKAPLAALRIPRQKPLLHNLVQIDHKVCHMYDTKNDAHPHSIEQETQPMAFLISKQVVPYWTHGGTCCPGGAYS
jgi:hypothetical protein